MTLSRIPLDDLLDDLQASLQDAAVCSEALDRGKRRDCYGHSIRQRMMDDLRYVVKLRAEIKRRCAGSELKVWAIGACERE